MAKRPIQSGVYKITNIINGNFYIGSSKDMDHRWRQHRYDANRDKLKSRSVIRDALRKHGIENFKFEIVEECAPVKETLLEREQHYIDTLKPIYNMLPQAGSRLGSKASDETRAKLTERLNARYAVSPMSEETKRKIGAGNAVSHLGIKGRPWTPEERLVISERMKGKSQRPVGYKHTPETVEKMRQSALNRENPEYIPLSPEKLALKTARIKEAWVKFKETETLIVRLWKRADPKLTKIAYQRYFAEIGKGRGLTDAERRENIRRKAAIHFEAECAWLLEQGIEHQFTPSAKPRYTGKFIFTTERDVARFSQMFQRRVPKY